MIHNTSKPTATFATSTKKLVVRSNIKAGTGGIRSR
jgi:hypothetical protein